MHDLESGSRSAQPWFNADLESGSRSAVASMLCSSSRWAEGDTCLMAGAGGSASSAMPCDAGSGALLDWSSVHGSFAEVLRGMSPPPSVVLTPDTRQMEEEEAGRSMQKDKQERAEIPGKSCVN